MKNLIGLLNRIGRFLGNLQWQLQTAIFRINPNTSFEADPRYQTFTWEEYRKHLRWYHICFSPILFICVGYIAINLYKAGFVFQLSIASAIGSIIQWTVNTVTGHVIDISEPLFILLIAFLVFMKDYVKSIVGIGPDLFRLLPQLAMREELLFRMNAEKWTWIQRFRSVTSFGLIHITMLIVPVAGTIAVGFAGLVLLVVYLLKHRQSDTEEALLEAAMVHTSHNVFVIFFGVIFLSVILLMGTLLIIQDWV